MFKSLLITSSLLIAATPVIAQTDWQDESRRNQEIYDLQREQAQEMQNLYMQRQIDQQQQLDMRMRQEDTERQRDFEMRNQSTQYIVIPSDGGNNAPNVWR